MEFFSNCCLFLLLVTTNEAADVVFNQKLESIKLNAIEATSFSLSNNLVTVSNQETSVGYDAITNNAPRLRDTEVEVSFVGKAQNDFGVVFQERNRRLWKQKTRHHSKRNIKKTNGPLTDTPKSPEEIKQQFTIMRNKWKNIVVGSSDFETMPELLNDLQVKSYIENLTNKTSRLYETMDETSGRIRLWKKEADVTHSADLTIQFRNLNTLAKAYGTKGTAYYRNDYLLQAIVSGLDFMTQKGRYHGDKYFDNWWDWQIGIPQEFTITLIIIHNDIEQEKVHNYVAIMSKYLPSPCNQLYGQSQDRLFDLRFLSGKNNGANRADQVISYLGLGLLMEDLTMVDTALQSIGETFELVSSGDGFYEDGSFVQHSGIPYAGDYGNSLVKSVANIFAIVSQTRWQIEEAKLNTFVNIVKHAFIPLIVNGDTMSLVYGRSISRPPSFLKKEVIFNLLITSEFANKENKQILQQTAKYWMIRNPNYFYSKIQTLKDLLLIKALMADTTIDTQTKPFLGSHMYGAMDRFIYSDNKITLGISLYSARISAFEAGNGENKKGWHTSDGMVYIYNGDQQFSSTYWPTIDWYRLPGTTVDTVHLPDQVTSFKPFKSLEDYAGGATDGKDAVVSMQLNKNVSLKRNLPKAMNLKAKKSWFIFDGNIICLGTDISGTTTATIETVIENRLLDPTSTYTFVDQTGTLLSANEIETHEAKPFHWYLLQSSKQNESIGYVMLDEQTIKTQQEESSGTYNAINKQITSNKAFTGTYRKILIEHGRNVTNGQYAYLVYPNATADKLKAINNSMYTILSNTRDVQAVKDNQRKLLGAAIWNKGGGTIEGIKVNRPAILLYRKEENNQVTLSISNPKQTKEVIVIELPQKITKIVAKDEGVVFKKRILVYTEGALGKTFQLTIKVTPKVGAETDVKKNTK